MNRISYDDFLRNPDLLDALERQARRERAAAFDRYVTAPVKALFHAERRTPAPRGLKYQRA